MRRNLGICEGVFFDTETGEQVEGDFDTLNRDVYLDLDTVLHFGKHKGRTLKDVIYDDENNGWSYFYWLYDKGFNVSRAAVKESNLHTAARKRAKFGDSPYKSAQVYRFGPGLQSEVVMKQLNQHLDIKGFEKHGIAPDDYDLGFGLSVNDYL